MDEKTKENHPDFIKWQDMYGRLMKVIPELDRKIREVESHHKVRDAFETIEKETGLNLMELLDKLTDITDPDIMCERLCSCKKETPHELDKMFSNLPWCDDKQEAHRTIHKYIQMKHWDIKGCLELTKLGHTDFNRLEELRILHEYAIGHLPLKRKLIEIDGFKESDFKAPKLT